MNFCSLYSGSSGNSIFVGSEKAKILIDAGLHGKKIDEALKQIGQNPSELDGIFITHEHIDHIKGVPEKAGWVEQMPGNIVKLRLGDIDKLQKVFEKLKLDNILFEAGVRQSRRIGVTS